MYQDLLQDNEWKVVGNRSFRNEEESWPPPKCAADAVTLKGSLYYKGEIIACTYEECKNLEVAAVWDRRHAVNMLMGDTKCDNGIRKPVDI